MAQMSTAELEEASYKRGYQSGYADAEDDALYADECDRTHCDDWECYCTNQAENTVALAEEFLVKIKMGIYNPELHGTLEDILEQIVREASQ